MVSCLYLSSELLRNLPQKFISSCCTEILTLTGSQSSAGTSLGSFKRRDWRLISLFILNDNISSNTLKFSASEGRSSEPSEPAADREPELLSVLSSPTLVWCANHKNLVSSQTIIVGYWERAAVRHTDGNILVSTHIGRKTWGFSLKLLITQSAFPLNRESQCAHCEWLNNKTAEKLTGNIIKRYNQGSQQHLFILGLMLLCSGKEKGTWFDKH